MAEPVPVCGGLYLRESYQAIIDSYKDDELMAAVQTHDKYVTNHYSKYVSAKEKAALRRWGTYLRREARSRGLLGT